MIINNKLIFLLVQFFILISSQDVSNEAITISASSEESNTQTPGLTPNNTSSEEEVEEPTLETTNPLVVEISSGKIEGREAVNKGNNKSYYAFQGIPYALPPVGDLRFREPVPAEKWQGIRPVLKSGPNCLQLLPSSGSEDCLYINVYTPKLNSSLENNANVTKQPLPVMVWLHGGAFARVHSDIDQYGPEYLLAEEVVVVTFNYRVGVFGFLSTEDYSATGNWGIKDQILALKWVQENIAKFSGDPDKVTLFGQSAGSACVSILIQSRLARGLFHGAILQSGTSLNPWAHATNPKQAAFAIARLLDIETDDTKELVEQLRKVDHRTLQSVATSTDFGETTLHNPLDGLVFAPSTEVNHPGAVLTNNSHEILKNGDFNRIPVIVGMNSQESLPFVNVLDYLKPHVQTYDLFSTRLVPPGLNMRSNLLKVIVARLIRFRYFGLRPILFSSSRLIQFVTDDQFARPIYEYVRRSSKYTPTYFYLFSYEGPLGVNGKKRTHPGVGHEEENNYLWNKETNIHNAPDNDILTRNRLIKLWTNFAKTLDPTPSFDPLLQNVTWAPANINSMVYLNIGKDLELNVDFSRYNIRFWDDIFRRYGRPPYDTY